MADSNTNNENKVVYWKDSGLYAFWDNPIVDRKVTHVSEEFLEGLVLSDGVDDDEGYIYPVEARRKYCDDAPHGGANIPASKKDGKIGLYNDRTTIIFGELMHQVEMAFTFYNLDGKNHFDSSQTLAVWVRDKDVYIGTNAKKPIVEKKLEITTTQQVVAPPDPVTPTVPITTVKQIATVKKKISKGAIIGIVAGILIITFGAIIYFKRKSKRTLQNKISVVQPYALSGIHAPKFAA